MVGWHHRLNGHGFGWTPGVGDGQGAWRAAVHGVTKSQTQLSELNRKKTIKNSNIWGLNNTLLNNQQITEEIKKNKIKICIETNENENMTTPNLWGSVKAVLRGRFIAV